MYDDQVLALAVDTLLKASLRLPTERRVTTT